MIATAMQHQYTGFPLQTFTLLCLIVGGRINAPEGNYQDFVKLEERIFRSFF